MEGKYRSSNIRFNMEDPIQAKAWEYLQANKGLESYGKLISRALVTYSKAKTVNISEESIQKIAETIAALVKDNPSTIQIATENITDCFSDAMASFAFN